MADKKRKKWQDMSFYELDREALDEHAESLGGEQALKAFDYLDELEKIKVEFTEEMKEEMREKLRGKMKRKQVKDEKGNVKRDADGKIIWEDIKPLYSNREIEKKISDITTVPLSFLKIKEKYCEEYYQEIMPERNPKDKAALTPAQVRAQKRAAARERVIASMNASTEAEASATGGKAKK